MEKELLNLVPQPWNYITAALLLLLILWPKIADLRASWTDRHLNNRQLVFEKARLEVEKLRVEIAAIKKQHDLRDLDEPGRNPVQKIPGNFIIDKNVSADMSGFSEKEQPLKEYSPLQKAFKWVKLILFSAVFSISWVIVILASIPLISSGEFDSDTFVGAVVLTIVGCGFFILFRKTLRGK
jgi:hypothetical protein